ncbi:bifunctional 2-polyprenyl-6-hydroxyphenol methylase/3-demethylubiquinol 3-O-methyltransferase UbiG [Solimonas flava]|uniref:bifunctional 2-polyprenyl-6-hydroxyphenol methylase/3-demethylubiquinol 3-O-methyltransferase UbiG n=1 Tax=Solimonas flava TaxID=415849 RepID=UPI00041A2B87|nr:bifunctional 2-polyprenyl-6-hydroxyphenol methylase/3-demethylubiquinol 3-O-methyltransferase UbiG [Solimonas flava]
MSATTEHARGNVDAREIANFERLASRWWDPRGEMATLHQINPPRVRYVAQCAGGLKGKLALDIGCGGGLLSEALAAEGAEVLGIDMAGELVDVARLHALESGRTPPAFRLDYRQISAEALAAERPQAFDLVCCMEMLEHVPDPASVIAACARLARPGGDLVFSTINRSPKAFALAVVGAEYVLNLVPRGTHDYEKFIRPSELAAWARAAGLEVVGMKGLRYNPLLKSARLADDIDVNYFMHCRKPA